MPTIHLASDGLVARDTGDWAETKLAFLDEFCPAAIQATATKVHRYYIDLFAGPGVNISRVRRIEFEGSPLRVLKHRGIQRTDLAFTHAVFVNANRTDHNTLAQRVDDAVLQGHSAIPRQNISLILDDANNALPGILSNIHRRAYMFVFADMEAPRQWPWASMRALRATGHESIDLYMLLPLDMALGRLFAYEASQRERFAVSLTRFFGTEQWRELVKERPTDAQGPAFRRALVDLYLNQLRTLWQNAGDMVDVRRRGRHRLYKMLFASDHAAGSRIARWIKARSTHLAGQGELFPEL